MLFKLSLKKYVLKPCKKSFLNKINNSVKKVIEKKLYLLSKFIISLEELFTIIPNNNLKKDEKIGMKKNMKILKYLKI